MADYDPDDRRSATADRSAMPDEFDRALGMLDGARGVLSTKLASLQIIPSLGIGGTRVYSVRTFREVVPDPKPDDENRTKVLFHTFVQVSGRDGTTRVPLPPKVGDLIVRQRESLTATAKRRQGKAQAKARMAAGAVPFQKKAVGEG